MIGTVRVETIRVSLPKFVYIHPKDFFQIIADGSRCYGQIPSHITQFLRKMFLVQIVFVEYILLHQVYSFAGFTGQTHDTHQ